MSSTQEISQIIGFITYMSHYYYCVVLFHQFNQWGQQNWTIKVWDDTLDSSFKD